MTIWEYPWEGWRGAEVSMWEGWMTIGGMERGWGDHMGGPSWRGSGVTIYMGSMGRVVGCHTCICTVCININFLPHIMLRLYYATIALCYDRNVIRGANFLLTILTGSDGEGVGMGVMERGWKFPCYDLYGSTYMFLVQPMS